MHLYRDKGEKMTDIPIIDAHHHLWDLSENYYPWLTDRITKRVCGEYSAIRKNYLLEDFKRDSSEVNLIKSIHVQAICDDPIAESRWLQTIAERPDSGGIPHGFVANVDLSQENAGEILRLRERKTRRPKASAGEPSKPRKTSKPSSRNG